MIIQYKLGCNTEFNNILKIANQVGLLDKLYYINEDNILFEQQSEFNFVRINSIYTDKTFYIHPDKSLYIYSYYYKKFIKLKSLFV